MAFLAEPQSIAETLPSNMTLPIIRRQRLCHCERSAAISSFSRKNMPLLAGFVVDKYADIVYNIANVAWCGGTSADPLRPPKESEKIMPKATCHSCVYAYWDPGLWLRSLQSGFPARPFCANHPDTPGRERETPPGGVCRNYRPRPADPDTTDGTVKRIPVTGGLYAYVDAADYEWLSQYTWTIVGTGYAGRYEKGKRIFMHRQIMNPPKGMVVDHTHGNRLDNTRANLHNCTPAENRRNRRKQRGTTSRYFGVYYNKSRDRWQAIIQIDGRSRYICSLTTELEAARAYDRKALELLGPAARLNFPEERPRISTAKYANHTKKAGSKAGTRQVKRNPNSRKKRRPA
jgi:hypothetical protein